MGSIAAGGRLRSLDGLRGVAALVVLLSHVVLGGHGALSAAWLDGTNPGGLAEWFLRTPLAVVWAGPELVIVFFVLSGFVLTRGLLRERVAPLAFFAGRLVRLYLPVWLALVPAALLFLLVGLADGPATGVGPWLEASRRPVGLEQVAQDLALVLPPTADGTLNGALWSLRWEVLFSLVVPFVVLVAGPLRTAGLAIVTAALWCVARSDGTSWATFAPPFAIGAVLALHEDRVVRWRGELRGRAVWPLVGIALCLLSADLWLPAARPAAGGPGALVVAGATLAVLCPLLLPRVAGWLERRPVQWLGSRSFSLYLVHLPIVVAAANALQRPSLPVLVAVAVPAALLAAEAFFRLVEAPVHHLARRATAATGARASAPNDRGEPAPAAA